MKFRFIQQEKRWFGVDALCRAMGVTRGGYWSWVRRKPSRRQQGDAKLLSEIRRIHETNRRAYSSPRIHDELHKKGVRCGRKRAERLMREGEVRAKQTKKYKPVTTDSDHHCPWRPTSSTGWSRQVRVEPRVEHMLGQHATRPARSVPRGLLPCAPLQP